MQEEPGTLLMLIGVLSFMEQVRRFKLRVNYGTILSSEVAKTELTNKLIQFFSETDGKVILQFFFIFFFLNILISFHLI